MWLLLWSCARTPPLPAPSEARPPDPAGAAAGVSNPALAALLREHWEETMARSPEWATQLGDHRFDDRLSDPRAAAVDAWLARTTQWRDRALAVPVVGLTPADVLTQALFVGMLEQTLATAVCQFHEWNLSARANVLVHAIGVSERATIETTGDADHLLARLRALPGYIDAESDNLRLGVANGRLPQQDSVSRVIEMLDEALAQADTPLLRHLTLLADDPERPLAEGAYQTWATQMRQAVEGGVRPALARHRDLLRDVVLPASRSGDQVGLVGLVDGPSCYEALIAEYTTLSVDAETLHQAGKADLAAIHVEFGVLGERVFGTHDVAEIFARLREDPALRFTSAEGVQQTAETALRRAEGAVSTWFGRLPKAPCTVETIPPYLAPYTTVAYYQPVRPDGSRPGIYFVNVHEPDTRPRHEAEVLAFHESVPGHHLQIALAQELGQLPAFRRYRGETVFVEGWALYVERLADEMGLYSGDVDRLGMLAFDSWRAARLVVDTGIHAKGWTAEAAVAFMLEATPLARNNVINEVDRYITTPGQALAYKTGQREILALRAEAERALGGDFDIRDFHDAVLGAGAVPLPVLRARIGQWVDEERASAASGASHSGG